MVKALKRAFPVTVPVLLGYLFVGVAFGMLFSQRGYSFIWAFLVSLTVYAGSMQFVMLEFFAPGVGLPTVALMTLIVNFRHVFYGLSLLETFSGMGKKKPYMVFSLTDETYSLLCSGTVPAGVEPHQYRFAIALLNQSYWIAGSVLGAVAGSLIGFDTTGIDFAMTALFMTILIDQWLASTTHVPVFIGLAAAVGALLLLGADGFIIPALLIMALVLTALKGKLSPALDGREEGGARHAD